MKYRYMLILFNIYIYICMFQYCFNLNTLRICLNIPIFHDICLGPNDIQCHKILGFLGEKWVGLNPGEQLPESQFQLLEKIQNTLPRKLIWQWKIHHLKMYFLLKMEIFQCHVSFRECTFKRDGSWTMYLRLQVFFSSFWTSFRLYLRSVSVQPGTLSSRRDSTWVILVCHFGNSLKGRFRRYAGLSF